MTDDVIEKGIYLYREILRRLAKKLPDAPPVVIGGAAVALHGSSRITHDVDVAFRDVKILLTEMYDLGFKAIAKADRDSENNFINVVLFAGIGSAFHATLDRRALMFVHDETQIRFDVWLAPCVPYETLLANSVAGDFGGVPVRVAAPKDLIALKRVALEKNPKRSTDLMDIEFLERKFKGSL